MREFDKAGCSPVRLKDFLAVLAPETIVEVTDGTGGSTVGAACYSAGNLRDRVVEYVALSERKAGHLRILVSRQ